MGAGTAGHCPRQDAVHAADENGARGRTRREGVGELSQPEREESTTAVRATTVPPFAGTGLSGLAVPGSTSETDLRRRRWRNGPAAQPSSRVTGLAGKWADGSQD